LPHGFDDAFRVVAKQASLPMLGQKRLDGSRLTNAGGRRVIYVLPSEVSTAGPVVCEVCERRRPVAFAFLILTGVKLEDTHNGPNTRLAVARFRGI
jgi:hypothetical protein